MSVFNAQQPGKEQRFRNTYVAITDTTVTGRVKLIQSETSVVSGGSHLDQQHTVTHLLQYNGNQQLVLDGTQQESRVSSLLNLTCCKPTSVTAGYCQSHVQVLKKFRKPTFICYKRTLVISYQCPTMMFRCLKHSRRPVS